MPAHRTQNSRHLRVDAAPQIGAPPINIISPTPRAFIFPDAKSNNADVSSYSFTSQLHPSHSLPNLLAFESSLNNGADSSWTDAQSSTGSQTSMFSSYSGSQASVVGSSFASPPNSLYSSYDSSPPDTSSTPPLSLSPSPPPPSGSSVDGEHLLTSSSPAPYPHPLPPHSNGQVRTQPPRPPNPWICFRNVRSAQYKSTGEFPKLDKKGRGSSAPSSPSAGTIGLDGEARRPRQADLSKHISLEWKALTDDEKAPYVRMSEEAKIIHAKVYPGYKYQPRRKLEAGDAKKSAKAKKSGKKSSKSIHKPATTAETGEHSLERSVAAADSAVAAIQLPVLGLDISQQGQDTSGSEQPKEWTWLPEQTLLPFSWDLDADQAAMGDIMHQLDANVDEQGENNEDVFREPFYFSFPPLDSSETVPAFFPFPETQGESGHFADPDYEFPSSSALGLQDGLFEDNLGISQPFEADATSAFDLGLGRDSLTNLDADADENGDAGNHRAEATDHDTIAIQPLSSVQDMFTSLPQFSMPPVRPIRRGSVPSYSHSISSDGLLRPPHASQMRPQGRSRRSSVPTLKFTPPDLRNDDNVRSIPTSNFSASGGITTSILIPKTLPRYDMGLERDLADYSRALSSIEPQTPVAKCLPPTSATASVDNITGMSFPGADATDIPLGFDFDVEFGDIIDIHASRDQSS